MKFKHKILMGPLLTAVAFTILFGITQRASNKSTETITRIQDEFFHTFATPSQHAAVREQVEAVAVAFAEFTTPGIPAPGCVPAPAK